MRLSLQAKINYLALSLFVLTALFSVGHHQSDEHYQILEFAQYKLGHISADELPWEFNEKIRPSLQPWITVVLVKLLNTIGISDPFSLTTLFRLLSGLLMWLIIKNFNKLLGETYFSDPKWVLFFSCCTFLLWYVPYISVRFSSENYATICFLLGLYFLIKNNHRFWLLALIGVCFGFSILFRYQLGVAIVGVFAWLLFIDKKRIQEIMAIAGAMVLVLAFGTYLDYLFYGEFVIAPLNYLNVNLIEGKAAEFGVKSFWYYMLVFLLVVAPPLSLILPVFFFKGIKKLKHHVFIWGIIPFVLIHFLIGHKEFRFLYPMSYIFIFITVYGCSLFLKGRNIKKYQRKLVKVAVVLNMIFLVLMIFRPAKGTVLFYKYLYENREAGNNMVLTTQKDFYRLMGDLKTTFYTPTDMQSYVVESTDDLEQFLNTKNISSCYYVHSGYAFTNSVSGYNFEKVYSVYPDFIGELGFVDTKKIRTKCIYLVSRKKK
ncbi:hypothetical protein [uncultured Kriegella sp.]|uniref:hypothetical protein n=1 Tax=uncultured Kriegella sp. TaxID=1798910 RepID=UPI0030DD76C6|tara:strand:+ start:45939 stop:47399 length:1461 start_codon:yes stop_codon:yes gene_type:complete